MTIASIQFTELPVVIDKYKRLRKKHPPIDSVHPYAPRTATPLTGNVEFRLRAACCHLIDYLINFAAFHQKQLVHHTRESQLPTSNFQIRCLCRRSRFGRHRCCYLCCPRRNADFTDRPCARSRRQCGKRPRALHLRTLYHKSGHDSSPCEWWLRLGICSCSC